MSGIIGSIGSKSGLIMPHAVRIAPSQFIYTTGATDITSTTTMVLSEYAEGMFHVNAWGGGGAKAHILNLVEDGDSGAIETGIESQRGNQGTTTYTKGSGTAGLNIQNSTNVTCTVMGLASGSMNL